MEKFNDGVRRHLGSNLACGIVYLLKNERVYPVEALSIDRVTFTLATRALLLQPRKLLELTKGSRGLRRRGDDND